MTGSKLDFAIFPAHLSASAYCRTVIGLHILQHILGSLFRFFCGIGINC